MLTKFRINPYVISSNCLLVLGESLEMLHDGDQFNAVFRIIFFSPNVYTNISFGMKLRVVSHH